MPNGLQRRLYAVGIFAPFFIVAEFVKYYGLKFSSPSRTDVLVVVVAVALILYHCIFINHLVGRNLPKIDSKGLAIKKSNDTAVLAEIASYFLPLGSLFTKVNIWAYTCVGFLVCLFADMNNTLTSPLWYMLGYHYHSVEIDKREFVLISKTKSYRNTKEIGQICRVFEDLLIDIKHEDGINV